MCSSFISSSTLSWISKYSREVRDFFFFFNHVFDGTSSSPIKIPYLDWGKMSLLYLRSLLYIP